MTVLLQLDGVSKFYGALKAVDSVDLTVDDGEALGVIGPNGAGKSTMFNLITGDVAPTAGRVLRGTVKGDRDDTHPDWPMVPFQFDGEAATMVNIGKLTS